MVNWKIIVKRVLRRIKYVFILKDLINWEYESCKRCGHCFRLLWSVKDELWRKVTGSVDDGGGSLCVDCFIELALQKNIKISNDDILIELFNP
ncbi:MAG: hypothetical protein PHF86_02610 [Candidatus Nanoarchaeia archaeon]|jgi:hypothetical protein|nr:hypothetical protein [Candidatus Nanoarchaeia archaeon]